MILVYGSIKTNQRKRSLMNCLFLKQLKSSNKRFYLFEDCKTLKFRACFVSKAIVTKVCINYEIGPLKTQWMVLRLNEMQFMLTQPGICVYLLGRYTSQQKFYCLHTKS